MDVSVKCLGFTGYNEDWKVCSCWCPATPAVWARQVDGDGQRKLSPGKPRMGWTS
jgi:hypothetical protein